MSGTNTFDLNDWQTGSGGEWSNWSVDDGTFVEVVSNAPICAINVDEIFDESLTVYPVPTEKEVTIEFSSSEIRTIQISDLHGRQLLKTTTGQSSLTIDLSRFPKGMYQLQVISSQGRINQGLVKI